MRAIATALALGLCCATAAQAQTAPDGLMRLAGFSVDRMLAVAGEAPRAAPDGPVEIWTWAFLKETLVDGDQQADTVAFLYRIDCQARTTALLKGDTYMGSAFQTSQVVNAPAEVAAPNTLLHNVIDLACNPAAVAQQTYANRAIARAATTRQFAARS